MSIFTGLLDVVRLFRRPVEFDLDAASAEVGKRKDLPAVVTANGVVTTNADAVR